MILIYNNPALYQSWTPEQRDELFGEVGDIMKELTESGELLATDGLADASTAITARVRDGVPVLTDGPFAEAKEQLAGYLMLECDRDRAVEIATRWPDAKYFGMEVREVLDFSGTEN
jgi:hypothetical protein